MQHKEKTEWKVKRSYWDSPLPAAVRYDNRLKGDAKVLYSQILLLTNENEKYCYATDQYLAVLFDKRRETINRYIKSLVKYGYIKIESTRQGKRVVERKIYPLIWPKPKKDSAKLSDQTVTKSLVSDQTVTKVSDQTVTKVSDQMVTVNDSNSNDSNMNELEIEGQKPAGQTYNKLFWPDKLGYLDGKTQSMLDKYATSLPNNIVQYAIDKTAEKKDLVSAYGYLKAVLFDLDKNRITDHDKLESFNHKRYNQINSDLNWGNESKKSTSLDQKEIAENRKYGLPDWLSEENRESAIKEQQAKSEKATTKKRSVDDLPFGIEDDQPAQPEPETKSISERMKESKANADNQNTIPTNGHETESAASEEPTESPKKVLPDKPTLDEQINLATGLAALSKGQSVSSYQIKLLDKYNYELSDKDKQLLAEYKKKHQPSVAANQG